MRILDKNDGTILEASIGGGKKADGNELNRLQARPQGAHFGIRVVGVAENRTPFEVWFEAEEVLKWCAATIVMASQQMERKKREAR